MLSYANMLLLLFMSIPPLPIEEVKPLTLQDLKWVQDDKIDSNGQC